MILTQFSQFSYMSSLPCVRLFDESKELSLGLHTEDVVSGAVTNKL